MASNSRELWLNNPRIKSAAAKQGISLSKSPKPNKAYTRLKTAIAAQGDWSEDSVRFCDRTRRLEFEFVGVDLLGTNTLLRFHQAKVGEYRNQWKSRAGMLIMQSQKMIRCWHENVTYPVRYEVAYISPHANLMDEDNLIGASKMVVDEIVRQTPIPDDSPRYLRYPITECKHGKQSKLLLVFYPIEGSPVSEETLGWFNAH